MGDDPTEAAIRREVARARQIIREDKLIAKLNKHFPDEPDTPEGQPGPPPEKEPATAPKPKGLWWGEEKE